MIRLAAALGISRAAATGHLTFLWLWALDYAPHGDVSSFTHKEIAYAADYEGDPKKFYVTLDVTGWVDKDGKLHDWDKYRLYFSAHKMQVEKTREDTRKRVERYRLRRKMESIESNAAETLHVTRSNGYNTSNTSKTIVPPLPPKGGGGGNGVTGSKDQKMKDVVDGFKIILGAELDSSEWDKVYGRKVKRCSEKLLTLFKGDSDKCLEAIEGVMKYAKKVGWAGCTPKTIVDNAHRWSMGQMR